MKAVDAEKGTITFDDKARAEVAGKTFTVAKDANIVIDGRPGKLAELPAGAYVNLSTAGGSADGRHAPRPGPRGLWRRQGSGRREANTITVDDTTYPVARDALVVIDGKQGPLAELAGGERRQPELASRSEDGRHDPNNGEVNFTCHAPTGPLGPVDVLAGLQYLVVANPSVPRRRSSRSTHIPETSRRDGLK